MKYLMTILIVSFSISMQAQDLGKLFKKAKKVVSGEESLSQDDVATGLKEALSIGVEEAVVLLSKEDGYHKSIYKILLPDEAQSVVNKLKVVPGFSNVEEELIKRMNRAAEIAAKKASPIFLNAITGMSFGDAMDILMGKEDAATRYLESTTRDQLYTEFRPVVIQALDEVNAREYWKSAVTAYNKIPFVKRTNPELDDHVSNKSLDGLFSLVEVKEEGIRSDIGLRTSPLLQKVFARQD